MIKRKSEFKTSYKLLLVIVFTLFFGSLGIFVSPANVDACTCPGYANSGTTNCGGSSACGAGMECTIACFDGDKNGDGIGDGPCSGCTPRQTPPPPPNNQPPPPSGWGGCGSCSGCNSNSGECRTNPEGQCVWDPSGCGGGGGGGCTPSYPAVPQQTSPVNGANVVGTIGGSVRFNWTIAGWGRGCDNVNVARIRWGIKTKTTCDLSQITWSTSGLGAATTGTVNITGADPYLKPNTTYCWIVHVSNGEYYRTSAVWEFRLVPNIVINNAAFATPTKCGGVRISGSSIYPDTNNPVTYTIDVSNANNDFAAGINYMKEVNLGMVPSTLQNAVTVTRGATDPRLRDYVGFKVINLQNYPNVVFQAANSTTNPIWGGNKTSGDLTNAAGRATLLGIGTDTTVTQLNNTTMRITFVIRFEDTFPRVPVLNAYAMAVMTYEGVDYSQDVVGANNFYYRRYDTWATDLQSPTVSVTGPTTLNTTPPATFRINWSASDATTGNTGISIFSGTCQSNSGTGGAPVNAWTTGSTGGPARKHAISVEHNNKIYTWGGCSAASAGCSTALNTMDIYDIPTATWTTGAVGPIGRFGATAKVYNAKIYIYGGYTGSAQTNRMDIYDIATNTWTTGASGGTARYYTASGIYNGIMYIFGGNNGTNYIGTTLAYNIATNTWSGVAAGPVSATTNAVLYNNRFYIYGGYNGSAISNAVNIYDPVANTWSTGTSGGTPRWMIDPVIYNGKIYAYGGCTNTTCGVMSNYVDVYDIAAGTWSVATNPAPNGRGAYRAVVRDGKMYVVKGGITWTGVPQNDILIYDITTGDSNISNGSVVQITQTTAPVTGIQLLSGVETQCLYVTDYTNEGLLGNKNYRQDSSTGWDGLTLRMRATDGACNSPMAVTAIDNADPWTMVRNGTSSASGGYSGFSIPELDMSTLYPGTWGNEAFLSASSTLAGTNTLLGSRQSLIDVYAQSYNDLNTDPTNIIGLTTWYDTINKILTDRYPTGITNLTANTLPANLNAYTAGQTALLRYTPASGTLSTPTTGANTFTCTRQAVILVNGNLVITPGMTYSTEDTKCIWVVKGNVTVNNGTDYNPIAGGTATTSDAIRGNVVITDGTFTVLADDQTGTSYADSLLSWPVISKAVNLQRNMGGYWNARYPSEFFQFDPSILYFLSDELAVTKFSIRPK